MDDFKESFLSDLSYWSKLDYEKHWIKASKHLKNGHAVSFITSITDPASSNFIRSWACYPAGRELIFQERIIFLENCPFDLDNPHENLFPYSSVTEDGEKISEWRVRA